ncbi:MAG: uncharacterized metal-binding protein YceD (DUF177 family) [Hyphomicrobiaceae bacterium]
MDQDVELSWSHKIVDIRERRTFKRVADAAECGLISQIFGDAVCTSLTAKYAITPLAPGRYRVAGTADARIELICGVTLDPLEQHILEPFDIEFRTGRRRDTALELNIDALGDDEPEAVDHGDIRIGRFVCEIVASAIDPFPRSDAAALEQSEAADDKPGTNPFAALSQLKADPSSD